MCREKIQYVQEPCCMRCGKPVALERTEYCHDCATKQHIYDRGCSLYLYSEEVSRAVQLFKYHNHRVYGKVFAEEMAKRFQRQIKTWNIQEIIPIPMYEKKRRQRGYNQTEILAKWFGRATGIPVNTEAVMRIRPTVPQKELNDTQRKRNLRGAFRVNPEWNPVGNVLLLDDIYTTGSTIDHVAYVLKKTRQMKVFFLTISIGQGV